VTARAIMALGELQPARGRVDHSLRVLYARHFP
jgi:hypothetical protein